MSTIPPLAASPAIEFIENDFIDEMLAGPRRTNIIVASVAAGVYFLFLLLSLFNLVRDSLGVHALLMMFCACASLRPLSRSTLLDVSSVQCPSESEEAYPGCLGSHDANFAELARLSQLLQKAATLPHSSGTYPWSSVQSVWCASASAPTCKTTLPRLWL